MAGFKVEKQTAAALAVDDLGLTLQGPGGTIVDLTHIAPEDLARSADLLSFIPASLLVVDSRDDTDATILSSADSTSAVTQHNDTHFGVTGGRFGALDDPTVAITDDYIVQYDSGTDVYESKDPAALLEDFGSTIGQIVAGMGTDGVDTTFVYDSTATVLVEDQDEAFYDAVGNNGTFVGGDGVGGTAYVIGDEITLSDGSVLTVEAIDVNDDVTDFTVTTSGLSNVTAGVTLTQSSVSPANGQVGFTLTPEINNISDGLMQWDVNDVFLRNTGDTLDSGTLTIASGAAVAFAAGSTITIDAAVTTATIATPGGGFTGDDDIINKFYVDSIAQGIDWKDSVRAATTPGEGDLAGVHVDNGGVGDTLTFDSTLATGVQIDGISYTGATGTGFDDGDRLLIKDQTDASENGIYVVTAGSTPTVTVLTRATDQDGTPSTEVSGGNTVFVEETSLGSMSNINTIWSVIWDGDIVVNTDPINWTQISATSATLAGIGLSKSANTIDLDVDDLVTATVVAGDIIAFHDLDGVAETSGSQTRKTTFQSVFNELDVPNAITSDGFVVRTADDTYTSRDITVSGAGNLDGLAISNGDGVAADPVIGLDIQNLPARSTAIDTTDRVAVWRADGTDANEYYTIADLSGAAGASDSFSTWTRTGNGAGGDVVADSSADTVTLDGGIGIDLTFTPASDTVSFAFTDSGMANTAITTADSIPFFDADNGGEAEFRLVSSLITDLGLLTSSNQVVFTSVSGDTGTATADTNADTISLTGATNGGITTVASDGPENVTFAITGADLTTGGATLATGDFIIVNDSADGAGVTSLKYTFGTMITDLDLLTGTTGVTDAFGLVVGGDGGVTATAIGTDTITVNGTGINVTTTNGGAAADTLDLVLDISDLTDMPAPVVVADEIAIHDITDGTTYRQTWTDVITDLGLQTTAYTTIGGDSGSTTASSSDTLNLIGGTNGGITTTASEPGTDQVAFDITPIDLTTGGATLATGDFIIVSDSADTATTVALKYTFGDMISDLGIITTLSAAVGEDLLGIDVTGTVIGLDILGLPVSPAEMATTDEFPNHDKSEGTAGANRKMTGQNIADGTATILGITGIAMSTFTGEATPADDQELLGFVDVNRASGVFSVEAHTYQWSDNKLSDNDWLRIGDASDADSGWVMPLQGTVVMASAHCENTGADTFDIDLYIDGVDSGPIANLTGGANAEDTDPTLDLDFAAGAKLRLRADQSAGTGDLADTTVAITVRWRV